MLTAEEYAKRREEYEDRLYKLFEEGRITLEELIELLDK
jgi:NADPH-dependent curcumin reductase CurA